MKWTQWSLGNISYSGYVQSELDIVSQVSDVTHCPLVLNNYKLEHFCIFNQETDYILSYFDNGEEYGNDDDDADEGPVY